MRWWSAVTIAKQQLVVVVGGTGRWKHIGSVYGSESNEILYESENGKGSAYPMLLCCAVLCWYV